MKRFFAATLLAGTFSIISSSAQAPAQTDHHALLQLAKAVQAQQVEIAANQTKIDEKLAGIAEVVRTARAFTARSK
jgi:hypothetical protein